MNGLFLLLILLFSFSMKNNNVVSHVKKVISIIEKVNPNYKHLSTNDFVYDIVNHPAFKGFGELLLPHDDNSNYYNTQLSNVGSLMPYHSHIDPNIVVGSLNYLIDEVKKGETIFYDFYSEEQKAKDHDKVFTGLFFFRGKPGAPFAVVCPGGGFSYVGSLHEGFPLACEIIKKDFNVFVIRYRIGSEQKATEDLAAAISYIFRNTNSLGISTRGYSLWGGSAGARMVANIALNGIKAYGNDSLPKTSAVIIAYTGQSSFSKDFPPAFITVSADDWIANANTVDRRVENLRNAGVEVEYHRYKNAGHGFGIGKGTDAEGWINSAIHFWEEQLQKKN